MALDINCAHVSTLREPKKHFPKQQKISSLLIIKSGVSAVAAFFVIQ